MTFTGLEQRRTLNVLENLNTQGEKTVATWALIAGGAVLIASTLFRRQPRVSLDADKERWYQRADRLGSRHNVTSTAKLHPGECVGSSGLVTRGREVVASWSGPMPPKLPWCYQSGPILEYPSPTIRYRHVRSRR